MQGSKRKGRRPGTWELRVDAGEDPLTRKRQQKSVTFHGTSRQADVALAELITKSARGQVSVDQRTVAHAIEVGLRQAELEALGARLEAGLSAAITEVRVDACVQRVGSMLTVFFAKGPIKCWTDADGCDRRAFARFFQSLLADGIYFPPAQFEAAFLSGAHTEEDIDRTIAAAKKAFVAAKASAWSSNSATPRPATRHAMPSPTASPIWCWSNRVKAATCDWSPR